MGEPGRLQSMGLLESDMTERHHFHFSLSCFGEGNGNPLQCSCLENPRDGGAWWAAIYGVTQSRSRLKRLSSSSMIILPMLIIIPRLLYSGFSFSFWKKSENILRSQVNMKRNQNPAYDNLINWFQRQEEKHGSLFLIHGSMCFCVF